MRSRRHSFASFNSLCGFQLSQGSGFGLLNHGAPGSQARAPPVKRSML